MSFTNIPSHQDFEKKALTIYINGLFNLIEIIMSKNGDLCYKSNTMTNDEIIEHLHKSSEFFLKSKICEISPYLLINQMKKIPDKNEKISFFDFYSIDAKDLIGFVDFLYDDFYFNELNVDFKQKYNYYRNKRNNITHSVNSSEINLTEVLDDYILLFYVFKKELDIMEFIHENVYLKYPEYNKPSIFYDFVKIIFDNSKHYKKIFKINETFRKNDYRQYCLNCNDKLLFFTPSVCVLDTGFKSMIRRDKNNESNKYFCLCCNEIVVISMNSCKLCLFENRGNKTPFYDDTCLHCFNYYTYSSLMIDYKFQKYTYKLSSNTLKFKKIDEKIDENTKIIISPDPEFTKTLLDNEYRSLIEKLSAIDSFGIFKFRYVYTDNYYFSSYGLEKALNYSLIRLKEKISKTTNDSETFQLLFDFTVPFLIYRLFSIFLKHDIGEIEAKNLIKLYFRINKIESWRKEYRTIYEKDETIKITLEKKNRFRKSAEDIFGK